MLKTPFAIFISHVHDEVRVAVYLKSFLDRCFGGRVHVFISEHSIPAGDDWFLELTRALANANLTLVLSSPFSVGRPWLHFESGLAWDKSASIIPICHRRMKLSDLPDPLRRLQALDLTVPEDVERLLAMIAGQSDVNPAARDSALFVEDLPDQRHYAADFYITRVLSSPTTCDVAAVLTTALSEAKHDGLLTSVHLLTALMSLHNSRVREAIRQSDEDDAAVERVLRQSIRRQPFAGDIEATETFRQAVDLAQTMARDEGVLMDQIHLSIACLHLDEPLRRHLQKKHFNVGAWQRALEKQCRYKPLTPYEESD